MQATGRKTAFSRSEQKTLSTTQNNRLTGKAPYKSTANLTAEDVTGQHDRRSVPPRLEGSIGESLRTGLAAADPIPWSAAPLTVARERHERLGLAREGNHVVAVGHIDADIAEVERRGRGNNQSAISS